MAEYNPCKFKSMVITENRFLFCDYRNNPYYDIYPDLLKSKGFSEQNQPIENRNIVSEYRKSLFVHIVVRPTTPNMYIDPEKDPEAWTIEVMQGDLPQWWVDKKDHYIEKINEIFIHWFRSHVFYDRVIDSVSGTDLYINNCDIRIVEKGSIIVSLKDTRIGQMKEVQVLKMANSRIENMGPACVVNDMFCASVIQSMETARVHQMSGGSEIIFMRGASEVYNMDKGCSVTFMQDNSCIGKINDNCIVHQMNNNARIKALCDHATVCYMSDWSYIDFAQDEVTINRMMGKSYITNSASGVIIRNNDTDAEIERRRNLSDESAETLIEKLRRLLVK